MTDYEVGSIVGRMKAEATGWSSVVEKMLTDADKLEARFKALGGIGAALATGAAIFIGAGIKVNAKLEQLSVAYRVLLKDERAAAAAMKYVSDQADKSPFQTDEVLAAGRQMVAYGLDLRTFLTDAMNLAAGTGKSLEETVAVFGRLKSGDFGEAFERLRDFGISRAELEGEGLVFDRSGSYQGSIEQALTAVQKLVRGKFGNMIEEQSDTWNGLISTVLSKVKKLNAEATQGVFEGLKGPLKSLRDSLSEMDPIAAKATGGVIQFLGALGMLVAIGSAIEIWGKKVKTAIGGVGLSAKTLFSNPWMLLAAGILAAVAAVSAYKSATSGATLAEGARKARENATALSDMAEAYRKNTKALADTNPGTARHAQLLKENKDMVARLGELYPGIVEQRDNEGKAIAINIGLLEKEITLQNRLAEAKTRDARKKLKDEIGDLSGFTTKYGQAGLQTALRERDIWVDIYQQVQSGALQPDSAMWRSYKKTGRDPAKAFEEMVAWGDRVTKIQDQIKKKQAEIDSLYTPISLDFKPSTTPPPGTGGGGNTAEARAAAILEIRDSVLDALNETEKREIASLNDRYAGYEKMGLKKLEIDGQVYTLQQAKEAELAAIQKKYADKREQTTKQAEEAAKQQAERELSFAEGLQRDLIQLQYDGKDEELKLLALEQADEEKRARETIQDQTKLDQVLADIATKYALKRKEIEDRYAKEAADTRAKLETAGLEYQHQYNLISDEEYYRRRIELARKNAERVKAEKDTESTEYQEAMNAVTQAEYDSIVAREGLEKELTAATLQEIRARLENELLAAGITEERTAAIKAALARISRQLADRAADDAEKAKENFESVKSSIQGGLSSLLKDLTSGQKSIEEIWNDMLGRMLDDFIDFLSRLAAEKLATWILSIIPGLSMEGGGVVPGLAVASAAGGMLTGAFSGGIPAVLHEKEMVLPKSISQFILDTMDQARGNSDNRPVQFVINAVDSQDVKRVLIKERDTILGILSHDYTSNGLTRRSGR